MTGSKPEHGQSGAEWYECPGNPGQRSVDAHRGPSLPHRSWSGGSTPLPKPRRSGLGTGCLEGEASRVWSTEEVPTLEQGEAGCVWGLSVL